MLYENTVMDMSAIADPTDIEGTTAVSAIERLSGVSGLWRARELPRRRSFAQAACGSSERDGIESGYPALDTVLVDHGWPRAGLTELLCDAFGIGELSLLVPALASLSATDNRLIAWIAPPFVPYAPALGAAGIDLDKVLLVHPMDHGKALWALEQALRTGVCSAVLGWLSEPRLKFAQIRRLQFAARQGGTWSSLFRPAEAAGTASPAELRLRLWPHRSGLRLDIVKRRGGWPLSGIELADASWSGLQRGKTHPLG